jgi:hypothetical protein
MYRPLWREDGVVSYEYASPLSSVPVVHIARCWKYFLLHSVSPGFGKQIMLISLFSCYNGSLVTWTVVSLTTAKFKPLIFFCVGLMCPILRTCSFSWFCMTSACCVYNIVTWSYAYGRLKAVCKSRTGVHLGKFPVVRWNLFCRRCNFKRQVSANSQAVQT